MRLCSIAGCGNPHAARSLCIRHYRRLKRAGSPYAVRRREGFRANGSGTITKRGYKMGRINGKKTQEHRWIMEKHLGRKLHPSEWRHHINGDRLDNRVENLELKWSSNHMGHHHKMHEWVRRCPITNRFI